MENLFHLIGLNPDVFLTYLVQELFEPYNIITALFVLLIPIGFMAKRWALLSKLILMMVMFYQLFTLKLQLGAIPDVSLENMLKLMVPVVFFWWGIGAIARKFVPLKQRRRFSKDFQFYIVLLLLCIFAALSLATIRDQIPFGDLARFIPELILVSLHAKILLITPIALGGLIYFLSGRRT